MAPETLAGTRLWWRDDPPWPHMPASIAVARLDGFGEEPLLANPEARAIPLPASIARARPRRQADYVAGRLCALRVVTRLTGRGTVVGRRADGAPRWPQGLTGSISHAGGQAIAAVAPTTHLCAIGVDVESVMTPAQAETLAPLILTAGERRRFVGERPALPVTPALLVTAAFSLKEALFKALHPLTGTMFFHEDAELLALAPDGRATLRLLVGLAPGWQPGTRLNALWCRAGDHVFSLVTKGQE